MVTSNVDPWGKHADPWGGKWSFDSENREKFPNKFKDVYTIKANNSDYINKAINYVTKYFPNNPGSTNYYLPITHKEAKLHLKKFIEQRLKYFGKYQDGISSTVFLGYHSLLAPLMNIGLITPIYVINKTLQYYNKNKNTIKISTVEGFIRQIIGWREYCNFIYTFQWNKMDKSNYFNHKNTINKQLWYYQKGSTGFDIIDTLINKTIKYGYLHHIERLMYIGNYFLLTNTKPYDVFEWFQSMFLDSYHVFMYPNVYGMSQFSSGDIMMTRPYFSSSNYIHNMSDYKRNSSYITIDNDHYYWNDIWDSLYYNFIHDNINKFKNNYSLANAVKNWNNKSNGEKKEIIKLAHKYINNYG
jgi:deoxyribodipyrimidine photolyase-related protein